MPAPTSEWKVKAGLRPHFIRAARRATLAPLQACLSNKLYVLYVLPEPYRSPFLTIAKAYQNLPIRLARMPTWMAAAAVMTNWRVPEKPTFVILPKAAANLLSRGGIAATIT